MDTASGCRLRHFGSRFLVAIVRADGVLPSILEPPLASLLNQERHARYHHGELLNCSYASDFVTVCSGALSPTFRTWMSALL